MMTPPKPVASLSAGLLARKGRAQPAMRRQIFDASAFTPAAGHDDDDLGWNDMGDVVPPIEERATAEPSAISSAISIPQDMPPPPVVTVREALAESLTPAAPEAAVAPVMRQPRALATRAQGRKAAFTLRLDDERHLRLRLLSAVEHKSAQQIVTAALDAYIADHPEVEALVDQAKIQIKSR